MNDAPLSPDLLFSVAATKWLKVHSRYIEGRTVKDYGQYLKPLQKVFGATRLCDIDITAIRQYQDDRRTGEPRASISLGAPKPIGNERVNMECSTLRQILREAGLWASLEDFYTPLPISHMGSGHALTADEERIFLDLLFSRPDWAIPAHCMRLMLKTGCGFGEVRFLRRKDVDLDAATITIQQGAKNIYRERTVPLIPDALESMRWIIDRWAKGGGSQPDEYILPCRKGRGGTGTAFLNPAYFDLKRPVGNNYLCHLYVKKGIRTQAAELIGPHVLTFRVYDCRVTAITRTLSDGRTSLHSAQRVFGHVSQQMQKRYYKPDADTLRKALAPLSVDPPAATSTNPQPTAAFVAAAKIDAKLGQIAAGFNPMALIKKLQSLNMDPQTILDVVLASSGDGE